MAADTTRRILIVDDDRALRYVLSRVLTAAGYALEEAGDGLEALRLLAAGGYDLVLLDIGLPGVSGLDVLAKTRALPTPPIVIIMTADETPETLLAALRHQAYRYLRKPFAMDKLIETVQRLLA